MYCRSKKVDMKVILGFFFVFTFFFLVSFAPFMKLNVAFAQEVSPASPAGGPTPPVDYQLPYPGLMPDNPLYFLKAARDKIAGFLISDPLKKAGFDLLLADKRLNGALYLFNKKKIKLAQTSASKAENYFGLAIEKAKEAKKEGRDTADLLRRLKESSKKHQEVLQKLGETSEAQRARVFEKEVELLNHQN